MGGEDLAVGELVGLGKVYVGLAMKERGFEHGLQYTMCVYFNHSKWCWWGDSLVCVLLSLNIYKGVCYI